MASFNIIMWHFILFCFNYFCFMYKIIYFTLMIFRRKNLYFVKLLLKSIFLLKYLCLYTSYEKHNIWKVQNPT